jgi:acyl dehydratase
MTQALAHLVGKRYPPFRVEVDARWIRTFADAIGDARAICRDAGAAREVGYRGVVAPPTFAFAVAMDASQPLLVLDDLGVDKTRTMHGEQGFRFHAPICAGDVLDGEQRVVDLYDKKNGALTFVVTETALVNQRGERVCELATTIVVRNG